MHCTVQVSYVFSFIHIKPNVQPNVDDAVRDACF